MIDIRPLQSGVLGFVWSPPPVRSLTVGGGYRFESRGEYHLRGVEEPWRLWSVRGEAGLPGRMAIDTLSVVRNDDRSEKPVETVTISPKFQVVIPKDIRARLKLSPGQKIQAILYEDRIELIPVRPIKKMRGFLKGISTEVPREKDRV